MNDTLVFAKTSLGLASYADPSAPLTQAERTLLIVIDGAKPVLELRRLNPVVGDCDLLVDRLQQAGYIVAKPMPAIPAMRAAVARNDDALPALRARAANFIAHQLGSYGDRLCRQLESAQSHDVLHNHIEVAAKVLEELKGRAVAEAFRREIAP